MAHQWLFDPARVAASVLGKRWMIWSGWPEPGGGWTRGANRACWWASAAVREFDTKYRDLFMRTTSA
ncbi:MAG: hypothetical protein ACRDTD_24450 [Pseudonocardiaceae bacterium]